VRVALIESLLVHTYWWRALSQQTSRGTCRPHLLGRKRLRARKLSTSTPRRQELHGFDSIPLYVRDGAALAIGARDDRPDYDYLDGLILQLYPSSLLEPVDASRQVTVTTPEGQSAVFTVERSNGRATVTSLSARRWSVRVVGGQAVASSMGQVQVTL
jgi:hypothetical protein